MSELRTERGRLLYFMLTQVDWPEYWLNLAHAPLSFIEAKWHIYASINKTIIDSYDSSPDRLQAIIWTNGDILFIGPKDQSSVKLI